MTKTLFLDRDGTLIKDVNYLKRIKDIKFLKDNIKGLKKFTDKNYMIIIVSNQSGVSRNLISLNKLKKIDIYLTKKLKENSIFIKKIYNCIHHPKDNCECRKPNIKFGLLAKKKYKISIKNSLMIGNSYCDRKFAKNMQIKYYNVGNKYPSILEIFNDFFKLN